MLILYLDVVIEDKFIINNFNLKHSAAISSV